MIIWVKDCCWWVAFHQPIKSLTKVSDFHLTKSLTLKMASAQVVETSVANNSPSHPDNHFKSRNVNEIANLW